MGGFPEDDTIHASRLIKLWVAEGFLRHKNGCLEEEAEEYLEDLVKRNLVIVTSRKINGKIKSCSLHDAVRDLCLSKAHEEKFLDVVDGCDLPQGFMTRGRRISSNRPYFHDIWSPTIRSIMCFQLENSPSWLAFLESSILLKVLNVVGNSHKEFLLSTEVFRLFHLKYVALIGSFSIPSAIADLVYLQTLIIHPTIRERRGNLRKSIRETSEFSLPLEIWRMQQLRHLILHDPYMLPHPPHGSDPLPLRNLQTLSRVQNLVWDEKMVQMIPHVKKLGLVYMTAYQDYHLHHLKHLLQLEKLHLAGHQQFSWWGKNNTFPRTLKRLTLVGGQFPWQWLGTVGSLLRNLGVLKLCDRACHGSTWKVSDDEFPQLKYLLIDNTLLEQWIIQSSPFPMLQHLVLRSCSRLGKIPEGIGEISTLESIEVAGYCTSTLLESLTQIKMDQESLGNDALQVRLIDPIITQAAGGNTKITIIPVEKLCHRFSDSEVRLFAQNFDYRNLIGEGRFGRVFQGVIGRLSATNVAIKRLASDSKHGETEFMSEMEMLANVRHCHLVSLIGYCRTNARNARYLVYEFMPNKTLAYHLFELSRNGSYLPWHNRLSIFGAARGLDYLHNSCGIIHGYVNSGSLLLDDDFTCKVSNFGLGNLERSYKGRRGHANPTYITMSNDAYAFGIVLLEVLTDTQEPSANWARKRIIKGKADQIVASNLRGQISQDCLKIFVEVVERCLDQHPNKRPKMAPVVVLLESALQQLASCGPRT